MIAAATARSITTDRIVKIRLNWPVEAAVLANEHDTLRQVDNCDLRTRDFILAIRQLVSHH